MLKGKPISGKKKKEKSIYNWSQVILDLGSQLAVRIIWEGDTLEDFAFWAQNITNLQEDKRS